MTKPETTRRLPLSRVVKPPHPLVVDNTTGLCRYVTQEDITRLERMNRGYETIVAELHMLVERNVDLMKGIEDGK